MSTQYKDVYKIDDTKLINIENAVRYKKGYSDLIPTLLTDYYINTIYNITDISQHTYIHSNPVLKYYSRCNLQKPSGSTIKPFLNTDYNKQLSLEGGPRQIFLLSSLSDCYNLEQNRAFYYEANEWGTPLIKGYIYLTNAYLYNTSPNPIEIYDYMQYLNINDDQKSLFRYIGPTP